jgi:hypothetical protein
MIKSSMVGSLSTVRMTVVWRAMEKFRLYKKVRRPPALIMVIS